MGLVEGFIERIGPGGRRWIRGELKAALKSGVTVDHQCGDSQV